MSKIPQFIPKYRTMTYLRIALEDINSAPRTMSSVSEISSLLVTLTSSIEVFKAELAKQDLPEPCLRTSKPHPIDDPSYITSPALYEARRVVVENLSFLRLLLENPTEATLKASIEGVP